MFDKYDLIDQLYQSGMISNTTHLQQRGICGVEEMKALVDKLKDFHVYDPFVEDDNLRNTNLFEDTGRMFDMECEL